MAFRKQLLLPVAALLFCGVLSTNADNVGDAAGGSEDKRTERAVADQLAEGEDALKPLLGSEVAVLDKLLKSMIRDMAASYGVDEEQLAAVARDAMQKIAAMDPGTLQTTLGQLAGLGGVDLGSQDALRELLGSMDTVGSSGDGI